MPTIAHHEIHPCRGVTILKNGVELGNAEGSLILNTIGEICYSMNLFEEKIKHSLCLHVLLEGPVVTESGACINSLEHLGHPARRWKVLAAIGTAGKFRAASACTLPSECVCGGTSLLGSARVQVEWDPKEIRSAAPETAPSGSGGG